MPVGTLSFFSSFLAPRIVINEGDNYFHGLDIGPNLITKLVASVHHIKSRTDSGYSIKSRQRRAYLDAVELNRHRSRVGVAPTKRHGRGVRDEQHVPG